MFHFMKNKGPRAGSAWATWYTSHGRTLPICSIALWLDLGVVVLLTLGIQPFQLKVERRDQEYPSRSYSYAEQQQAMKSWGLDWGHCKSLPSWQLVPILVVPFPRLWMGVVANVYPLDNLCRFLLYLFQSFLPETFCCLRFLGWCVVPLWMAASKFSCKRLSRQTTGQPSMVYSNNVLYAGWWQMDGLSHIQPLHILLYLL